MKKIAGDRENSRDLLFSGHLGSPIIITQMILDDDKERQLLAVSLVIITGFAIRIVLVFAKTGDWFS